MIPQAEKAIPYNCHYATVTNVRLLSIASALISNYNMAIGDNKLSVLPRKGVAQVRFPPRLQQILLLVLGAEQPTPVGNLAERLQLSKRTIYRELAHADKILAEYNLLLQKKPKQGIFVAGLSENKNNLLAMLNSSALIDPRNIEERQKKLIYELLIQDEPQKIYLFSKLLQVSESTVNHDLGDVDKWFAQNDILLVRKPGLGMYLLYQEENYRKACMRYIYQNAQNAMTALYEFVERETVDKVVDAVSQTRHKKLENMADFSYLEIIIFLSLAIRRISIGKSLCNWLSIPPDEKETENYQFAQQAIGHMQQKLKIAIPDIEVEYFYVYIKGAKNQHIDSDSPIGSIDLLGVIYEMVNQYEPSIAFDLKNDSDFINGLAAHLNPTVIRIQSGHKIYNPFQNEIMKQYPDIYAKTKKAAEVLKEALHCDIPEDEIGLLALHFGGACVRLELSTRFNRKANVGVVCASGIGISTLLSSRLAHIFHNKINVRQLSLPELDRLGAYEIDIVISTLPLPLPENAYLQVQPMLTEEDIKSIDRKIDLYIHQGDNAAKKYTDTDLISCMDTINLVSTDIGSILRSFRLHFAEEAISFDELFILAGSLAAQNDSDKWIIYDAFIERERLSTQMIPEFEILFLHAKSAIIKKSIFLLIRAKDRGFTQQQLSGIRCVIVMLIPENHPHRTLPLAAISSEIFDNEDFLAAIKKEEECQIRKRIEKILNNYLLEFMDQFKK